MEESFLKEAGEIAEAVKPHSWLKFVCIGIAAVAVAVSVVIVVVVVLMNDKPDDQPTDEELIEQKIEDYATAHNTGDIDKLKGCLSVKPRKTLELILNVMDGVMDKLTNGFSIDMSKLFSWAPVFIEGEFMHVEVLEIEISGKSAVATATMSTKTGGTQDVYFTLVYENDGWYISNLFENKPGAYDYAGSIFAILTTSAENETIYRYRIGDYVVDTYLGLQDKYLYGVGNGLPVGV